MLGLAAAVALGAAIYRGGVRLNLARFFRVTGVVLVVVAAGLVASAPRSGAEAGWATAGQGQVPDLGAIVRPGTVWASLVTGILGIQATPRVIEVAGWLVYAVPMLAVLLAPGALRPRLRASLAGAAVVAAPLVLLAGTLGGAPTTASAGSAAAGQTVRFARSDAACRPGSSRLSSGPATFVVTGDGAPAATEVELVRGGRTLAEAEDLAAGISRSFSVTLQPGRYELRCPGARNDRAALTVGGARAVTSGQRELRARVLAYRRYVERETSALVTRTRALRAALASGDLAAARRAYAVARVPYERIEPIAESFGALDADIDARAGDVPRSRWTGFHPIERRLWADRTTRGTARLARGLVADSVALHRRSRDLDLASWQIANGANELLDEVAQSKITGEEEGYSHLDLLDFAANVAGAREAFDVIRPALARRDAPLARDVAGGFRLVDRTLARHARGGGYVRYTALRPLQVRRLTQALDALADPMANAPGRALTSDWP